VCVLLQLVLHPQLPPSVPLSTSRPFPSGAKGHRAVPLRSPLSQTALPRTVFNPGSKTPGIMLPCIQSVSVVWGCGALVLSVLGAVAGVAHLCGLPRVNLVSGSSACIPTVAVTVAKGCKPGSCWAKNDTRCSNAKHTEPETGRDVRTKLP
jgi:hypothetical protein